MTTMIDLSTHEVKTVVTRVSKFGSFNIFNIHLFTEDEKDIPANLDDADPLMVIKLFTHADGTGLAIKEAEVEDCRNAQHVSEE